MNDIKQNRDEITSTETKSHIQRWIKNAWGFITKSEHSNALIAILSFFVVLSSGLYTGFSIAQYYSARKAMWVDERPWIGEIGFQPVVQRNAPLTAVITISNVGRSPAFKLRMRMDDKIFQVNNLPTETFKPTFRTQYVRPGAIYPANPWAFNFQTADKIATEELYCEIMDGEVRLYHFDEAIYDDAFGRPHYSHFCGWFNPSDKTTPWVACDYYNETDSEK